MFFPKKLFKKSLKDVFNGLRNRVVTKRCCLGPISNHRVSDRIKKSLSLSKRLGQTRTYCKINLCEGIDTSLHSEERKKKSLFAQTRKLLFLFIFKPIDTILCSSVSVH